MLPISNFALQESENQFIHQFIPKIAMNKTFYFSVSWGVFTVLCQAALYYSGTTVEFI